MSKELTFGGRSYIFKESNDCYVSPYSLFMLEQYPLNLENAKTVCDLGAGTGILSIVASSWSPQKIVMIDTNPDCYNQANINMLRMALLTFGINSEFEEAENMDEFIAEPEIDKEVAELNDEEFGDLPF